MAHERPDAGNEEIPEELFPENSGDKSVEELDQIRREIGKQFTPSTSVEDQIKYAERIDNIDRLIAGLESTNAGSVVPEQVNDSVAVETNSVEETDFREMDERLRTKPLEQLSRAEVERLLELSHVMLQDPTLDEGLGARVHDQIEWAEQRLLTMDMPEPSTEEVKEEVSTEETPVATTEEVPGDWKDELRKAMKNHPVDDLSKEELVVYGNQLLEEMRKAEVNNQPELVADIRKQYKKVRALAGEPVRKNKKGNSKRDALNKKDATGAEGGPEETSTTPDSVPESPEPEKVPEPKAPDAAPEVIDELEIPPQEMIDLVTEDLPPEEAEVVADGMIKRWYKISRRKIFGDMTAKEIATNISLGYAVGAGVKVAFRTALGLSGGALAGAAAGATTGVIKKIGFTEWKDFKYGRVEKKLAEGKVGDVYEQMKSGKIKKTDALKLLADHKAKLIEAEDVSGFQELLEVEGTLIKNEEELMGLQGAEKLKKYMELTSSSLVESETSSEYSRLIKEREQEIANLKKDINIAGGREWTKEQIGRAALTGAIGGALGATIAHFVGGVWDSHFGHHNVTGGGPDSSAAVAKVNVGIEKLYQNDARFHPDLVAHPAPEPHQFGYVENNTPVDAPTVPTPEAPHPVGGAEAAHATAGNENVSELKVKGTVWSTVKNFFKSKGIEATDDQLNTASRFLAHENHIGIAADHPDAGSYNVLDTKVPDGMTLHGVDKLADIDHLPHVSAEHGLPELPKIPEIHIAHVYTPDELSEELGVDPGSYLASDPAHTTIADLERMMANGSESGEKMDIGLKIFDMEPMTSELDMTVDEFLKSRIAESDMLTNVAADAPTPDALDFAHAHHLGAMTAPVAHEVLPHVAPPSAEADLPHLDGRNIAGAEHEPEMSWDNVQGGGSVPAEVVHAPTGLHAGEGFYQKHPEFDLQGNKSEYDFWSQTPDARPEMVVPAHTKGEKSMLKFALKGFALGVGIGVPSIAGAAYAGKKLGQRDRMRAEAVVETEDLLAKATTIDEIKKLEPDLREVKIMSILRNEKKKPSERALGAKEAKEVEKLIKNKKYDQVFEKLLQAWKAEEKDSVQRKDIELAADVVSTFSKNAAEAWKDYREKMTKLEEAEEVANQTT